jgi:hypothetical protein
MDQKWYQDFTVEDSMPRAMLFEVLTASNYMTIKPLLDLCCLKVTFELTNKSAEEVNIRKDGFILSVLSVPTLPFIDSFSLISCLLFLHHRSVKSSTFPS